MSVRASQPITLTYASTRYDTGEPLAPDSIGAGVYINGALPGGMVVSTSAVSGTSNLLWKITFTLPSDLAMDDCIDCHVLVQVNGVLHREVIWREICGGGDIEVNITNTSSS